MYICLIHIHISSIITAIWSRWYHHFREKSEVPRVVCSRWHIITKLQDRILSQSLLTPEAMHFLPQCVPCFDQNPPVSYLQLHSLIKGGTGLEALNAEVTHPGSQMHQKSARRVLERSACHERSSQALGVFTKMITGVGVGGQEVIRHYFYFFLVIMEC